jgi:peptidyl-prolyl cis-trans isomerase SurA
MKRTIAFAITILTFCGLTFAGWASVSIVATVNGEPITSYELEQRILMLKDATNIEITEHTEKRISDDALQMLIDDSLKQQVARDGSVGLKSAATAKANELIDASFAGDGKTGAATLREIGIDPMTVQSKFVSDLIWSDHLQRIYSDKFAILDDKIDAELVRLEKNASSPQIKLSEIVLTPAPNRNLKQTLDLATQMVAAIQKGANFNAIAQQYSGAGSAKQGGRVGWLLADRLPSLFIETLKATANGETTDPIELDGAIYIFRKDGERKNGLADESQTRIWLARAMLSLPADATNADRLEAGAQIERDTATINSCDRLEELNASYGSAAVARLNEMVLGDLAPQMQKLVSTLADNQASEPIAFAEGIATMMVCRREKPELNLPSREEVRRVQYDRLFGDLSERHLVRLRRGALIDMRN